MSHQPGLHIRPATLDDERAIHELFYRTGLWVEGFGLRSWPVEWPQPAFILAAVSARIERGETFVASYADAPLIATITVQDQDVPLWPDDGLALYVHGLAVDRCCAGRGVGAALLRWAEARARRLGLASVRLDCTAENTALRAYYTGQGYGFLRERPAGTYIAALFEQRL